MAGKICDVCGTENEPGAAFCVSCHSYLAWDETGLTVTGPPTAGGGYPTPRTQRARLVDADELFRVFAEHAAVTVPISGEPATLTVQVNNTSSIVDGFAADAPTAPPWLSVQSTQVDLLPGSSGALSVTMRIASQTLVPAQQLRLVVRVWSLNQAPAQHDLPVLVTIPVIDVPVRLQPSPRLLRVRDREVGEFTVAVDNTNSNRPARLRFSGTDPELAVRFHFDPPVLEVGPATTGSVRVVVVGPKPAPGEEVMRSLTVTANDGTRNVDAPITFQQSASASAMTTLSLRVEPSIVRVQDADDAVVQVVADNRRGTSGVRLFLEGRDPERAIRFTFTPSVVDVGSGQVQPVNVRLDSRRPQPGREWTRQFTIAASDGRTSVESSGSLVQASSRAAMELLGIRLEPSMLRLVNRRRGVLGVTVDNRNGAQPVRVAFRGADPESIIRFTFSPSLVDVPPGEVATATVTLTAPRPHRGQELTRGFAITASDGRTSVEGSGSLVQTSRPHKWWRWLMTVLGIILLIAGVSDPEQQAWALLVGIIVLIIGVALLLRSRSRPRPSSR
jgi:hypothetical protein